MFSRQIRKFTSASTSNIWIQRATALRDFTVNTSLLAYHLARQVAINNKMGIPDIGQAIQGYSSFIGAFSNGAWRKVTVSETLTLLGEAVKIGGIKRFFLVGEMIGRGSVIGYQIPGTDRALNGGGH